MPDLKGRKTHDNLKEAFAGESQANRRYLYFAQKADVEGYPDVAALFRSVAEGETGHAFGHFDFLAEVGDPVTGVAVGATDDNLKSAVAGETYEYTEMYPGFAHDRARRGLRGDRRVARDAGPRREEPRRPLPAGSRIAQLTAHTTATSTVPAIRGTSCRPRAFRRSDAVRKLTVDDILDVRALRARARRVPRDDHRAEAHAAASRSAIMTIVFENTETMRWQVQEMARAERMLRDEQIAHEVETYNELIPDDGRALGDAVARADVRAELREWLPQARRHRALRRARARRRHDDRRRAARRGRAPHPRRHHRGGALPEVRLSSRGRRRSTHGPGAARGRRTPSTRPRRVLDAEQHAELLADLARASRRSASDVRAASRSAVSIPISRCPARQHADDAGYDLVARVDAHARAAAAVARSSRPASRSRSRRATPGFVQPRSGLALRHGVTCLNTPGLVDAGLPRRDPGARSSTSIRPTPFTSAAAIASRSS